MNETPKRAEFDIEEVDDDRLEDVAGGALNGCEACDCCRESCAAQ